MSNQRIADALNAATANPVALNILRAVSITATLGRAVRQPETLAALASINALAEHPDAVRAACMADDAYDAAVQAAANWLANDGAIGPRETDIAKLV